MTEREEKIGLRFSFFFSFFFFFLVQNIILTGRNAAYCTKYILLYRIPRECTTDDDGGDHCSRGFRSRRLISRGNARADRERPLRRICARAVGKLMNAVYG